MSLPTDADVNEAVRERRKEENWQFAFNVNRSPWTTDETKKRHQNAARRHPPDAQRRAGDRILKSRTLYERQKPVFDAPDKARGLLAVITDVNNTEQTTKKVIGSLSKNPRAARRHYDAVSGSFLSRVNTFTFKRPFRSKDYQNKKSLFTR